MPEYVTLPELKDALAQASTPGARTAADLADTRLQAALDEAHAEVVGKLRTRYVLPADPATLPGQVRALIVAIATYVATLEWMQGRDLSKQDPVVLRYVRAEQMLRQISDGTLSVDLATPAGGADADAAGYESLPDLGLTDDVAAPTYYGLDAGGWGGWQGGGRLWR